MTIQAPNPTPTELEIIKSQIEAQQNRSAALARLCDGIRELHTAPLRAQKGDIEAERLVSDTLRTLVLCLNPIDIDIINRALACPDYFELHRIAGDARRLYEHIDATVIDKLKCRATSIEKRADGRSADAYRAKQQDRKSAYTRAYEAAAKLSLSQRRQLAASLLES